MSEITWQPGWILQGDLAGIFILDHSLLDGPDVLGDSFVGGSYTAIPNGLDFTLRRGRSGIRTSVQAGECHQAVLDEDGDYNPQNAASPNIASLLPLRPFRIVGTHLAITYPVYYGFLTDIDHDADPLILTSNFSALDLYEWMGAVYPTIASTGATTTGAAIGKLLDALDFTDPSMRDLDTGSSIPDFSTDGTKTVLEELNLLLQADLGICFVQRDEVVRYMDRASRWNSASATFTFTTSQINELRPSIGVRNLVNRQTVTRTGGVAQTYTDTASVQQYGFRDGQPITTTYLNNDTEALDLATFLVALQSSPRPLSRSLTLNNLDDPTIVQQLTIEVGDHCAVPVDADGATIQASVEQIQHSTSEGGTILTTTILLSEKTLTFFTLDVSLLDGSDVLAY